LLICSYKGTILSVSIKRRNGWYRSILKKINIAIKKPTTIKLKSNLLKLLILFVSNIVLFLMALKIISQKKNFVKRKRDKKSKRRVDDENYFAIIRYLWYNRKK